MSEDLEPIAYGPRPAYKDNPIWIEAISVTRAAYDLAEKVRPDDPLTARHLRRASVTIPAHLAGALSADDDEARRDHVTTALGALAEVTRQAERVGSGERAAADELARRTRELERAVSFQLGDAGTLVC
ncbi:MAG: four helix bundle protein [Acidobacteriota bacterium]